MSEMAHMVVDTCERFLDTRFGPLQDRRKHQGWSDELWTEIEELGLGLSMLDAEAGGFGLNAEDSTQIIRIMAARAAAVPVAETMATNWLLARAGLEVASGPATLAHSSGDITLTRNGNSWHVEGRLSRVPWGSQAKTLLISMSGENGISRLVRISDEAWITIEGQNLAGWPRDDIIIDANIDLKAVCDSDIDAQAIGAAVRSIQISGALDEVVRMTAEHVATRVQFGKPLAKLQAVQQSVAQMAGQVAASAVASGFAVEAFAAGDGARLKAAVAKARVSEAVPIVVAIAHQLHGAIGLCEEHPLPHLVRALRAWRTEFGNENFWATVIGEQIFASGDDNLWPFITSI